MAGHEAAAVPFATAAAGTLAAVVPILMAPVLLPAIAGAQSAAATPVLAPALAVLALVTAAEVLPVIAQAAATAAAAPALVAAAVAGAILPTIAAAAATAEVLPVVALAVVAPTLATAVLALVTAAASAEILPVVARAVVAPALARASAAATAAAVTVNAAAAAAAVLALGPCVELLLRPRLFEGALGHSVFTLDAFASDVECEALIAAAQRLLVSYGDRTPQPDRCRLSIVSKIEGFLLRRLLSFVEKRMPELAESLFGQKINLADMSVTYSPGGGVC